MAKKDSTIFYQDQVDICRRHFTPEQFGRLMIALFEVEEGNDPQVDEDIIVAFEFMALQKRIDRDKYEEKCRKNRENGAKGGRPKKTEKTERLFQKPNGFFKNPNDNDNDNDNENENENDNDAGFSDETQSQQSIFHGSLNNVELTDSEYGELMRTYERTDELIDKVSRWLDKAKGPVPDHVDLCHRFAVNESWPKRKIILPVEPITVEDPPSEEEQERLVADMRSKLNGALKDN